MAWDHLAINKPHLVYIILGGFTSLFMLCSSVIKERLYIGEATVATICGIIFGPHAANLIDPGTWGNTDQITLEFARIVLVVQCFAVGVELPKAYMERHWRSVVFLLVPVMTFGWLVTSLFIWALVPPLNWLDSLCVAACVTATDPVLASSVVGKGKFAKRVPKHLRDLLSAESGCNDGMAFPFIYLPLYIIRYRHEPHEVALEWICITILYECIFGAVYGFAIGYIARRAIRYAHERDIIDRESFLVFYFVLALFCAGSGSILGVDDLLVGFACGVGFSNDGWFTEKTEESHVSNVIDLLINLAFFVYFGTIIPWPQYNSAVLGLNAWRLVVIAILVLLFRRIPIMLALKPVIPDIKTWREALFAGHFGPIGVGAIFVAILARAELETDGTTPLAQLPEAGFAHLNIIELIWPITTFLVICSIIVHGSSIAVFTLGKHINTLTLTMSYTQGVEDGPSWMDRLPRIQSRSKTSMSLRRPGDEGSESMDEKDFPAGVLPGNFLRRQREEDTPLPSSRRRSRRQSRHRSGGPISQSAIAPQRKPTTQEEEDRQQGREQSPHDKKDPESPESPGEAEGEVYEEGEQTVYEDEEGNVLKVEDSRPGQTPDERQDHEGRKARELMAEKDVHHGVSRTEHDGKDDAPDAEAVGHSAKDMVEHPAKEWRKGMKAISNWGGLRKKEDHTEHPKVKSKPEPKRGPARAYQFGNTIIVEDEDGEVLKKYDIPAPPKRSKTDGASGAPTDATTTRQRLYKMGSVLNVGGRKTQDQSEAAGPSTDASQAEDPAKKKKKILAAVADAEDDERLRFTISAGGRRMSKAEFIQQISQLDPRARARFVESSNVSEDIKEEARQDADETFTPARRASPNRFESSFGRGLQGSSNTGSGTATATPNDTTDPSPHYFSPRGDTAAAAAAAIPDDNNHRRESEGAAVRRMPSDTSATGPEGLTLIDSNDQTIPFHDVSGDLRNLTTTRGSGSTETPAQRRRREARARARDRSPAPPPPPQLRNADASPSDSEDDGTERIPPPQPPSHQPGRVSEQSSSSRAHHTRGRSRGDASEQEETAAERRRREGALGVSKEESDSEEEDAGGVSQGRGIRFAEPARPAGGNANTGGGGRLRWGNNRGR